MTSVPSEIDCIGHNDLGPYNMVFSGCRVVAIIDWDFAGPSSRARDLAYAAHRFVPLSVPRSTRAFGWDPLPDQGSRLRKFAAAYGDEISPAELLDLVADALDLGRLGQSFDSVVDCGLFHTFDDAERVRYVAGLASVVASGGRCTGCASTTGLQVTAAVHAE
ncbi:MAG TPA: phosphotransferase [Mycobacteriales bacterium]|jgi:hypothetical protein|nr:phosphotransferase [Mycobacteriales bacterium]